jgi:DNA-binding CsgD family transcriptional regulator
MEVEDLDGPEFEIAQLAAEGYPTPAIAGRLGLSDRTAAARVRVVFAKLGVRNRPELRAKMTANYWRRFLERIRTFIDAHGHSRVPEGYEDDEGPFRPVVERIRRHHAGPADASADSRKVWYMTSPFPGIDYASELDRLPGWEW